MGANSRRRRAEKARRRERQRVARGQRKSTTGRGPGDALDSELYFAVGRVVDKLIDLLLLGGVDNDEVAAHFDSTLQDLPPAAVLVVSATVSQRVISSAAALVSAGWDSGDLSEYIAWRDARSLDFLERVLEVTPIATFTADDLLTGLRLAAILEDATRAEASVSAC